MSLDERHIMTIALGPLAEAIESFQRQAWKENFPPRLKVEQASLTSAVEV